MRAEVGNPVFERRIDAAHERAPIDLARRQHRLSEHVGRGVAHMRIGLRCPRHDPPVSQRPAEGADLDVRSDRQDARAQLLLEAVHDRQHDDQRSHTQGDTEHRYGGDE
jgi:hypothetical protein